MHASRLILPLLLVLVAACATPGPSPVPPASGSPSVAPSPTAAPGTPAPVATRDPVATPATTPDPILDPGVTEAPADPDVPEMTPAEARLAALLRGDAAVRCTPRRADLPDGALAGVECRPDDALVARVGIYAFPSANEAAHAYLTRLASSGVDVNAGDCARDVPGDAPWSAGDGEGSIDDPGVFNFENAVLSPDRAGCFHDEDGTANVRLTCAGAYIGVLGKGTDLSELQDWAWRYPAGYEPGTPDRPGVCVPG